MFSTFNPPLTRIVLVAENTGVLYFELVAEQVSKLSPSSSLEVGCNRKVPPEEVLFVPSASLLVMENSGGGRLWPVQLMVVEEPLFTEAGVDRSATSVGGSVQDNVEQVRAQFDSMHSSVLEIVVMAFIYVAAEYVYELL